MLERRPAIAIVGGGFSGAMVAVQLILQAKLPFDLHLIEPGEVGEGIAYGTDDPEHLLNVPVSRMGAIAGDPEHFWRWLKSPHSTAARESLIPGQKLEEGHFAPRRLYGAYVREVFADAFREAGKKHISVMTHRAEAKGIELKDGKLRIALPDILLEVDRAVLAIGNLQPPQQRRAQFPGLGEDSSFVLPNAWNSAGQKDLTEAAARANKETMIFILGTGLTTVDTILTLERLHYPGRYVLLSRNGLLPLAHAPAGPMRWENPPPRLRSLMRAIRITARQKEWRGVVDGLRPLTVRLWKGFTPAEKTKFLRRFFTLWNIHRHRMAPQIAARMEHLIQDGRLNILRGRLEKAGSREGQLSLHYQSKGESHEIAADYAIACTGPGYDVSRTTHPFLRRLIDQGLVRSHSLRAGLEAKDYLLPGKAEPSLYGIGPVLIGERLESTAVPELRDQARDLATELLASLEKL